MFESYDKQYTCWIERKKKWIEKASRCVFEIQCAVRVKAHQHKHMPPYRLFGTNCSTDNSTRRLAVLALPTSLCIYA